MSRLATGLALAATILGGCGSSSPLRSDDRPLVSPPAALPQQATEDDPGLDPVAVGRAPAPPVGVLPSAGASAGPPLPTIELAAAAPADGGRVGPVGEPPDLAVAAMPVAAPADAVLQRLNAARGVDGLPPLAADPRLAALAQYVAALLSQPGVDPPALTADELRRLLSSADPGLWQEALAGWDEVAGFAAGCDGCGGTVTEADLDRVARRWAGAQAGAGASRFGFAIRADGQGRKVAVGLFAAPPAGAL